MRKTPSVEDTKHAGWIPIVDVNVTEQVPRNHEAEIHASPAKAEEVRLVTAWPADVSEHEREHVAHENRVQVRKPSSRMQKNGVKGSARSHAATCSGPRAASPEAT